MIAAVFLSGPVSACLWDRDTLKEELAAGDGLDAILEAIVGRFERNPPRYYEMRLERIEREYPQASGVELLELCDDAGVASDRLGRCDEALEWMQRKAKLLEDNEWGSELRKQHEYRFHANIGTFYIHRWLKGGADLEQREDVENARQNIEAALQINPDAHFGRERMQLKAIEWLADESAIKEKIPLSEHLMAFESQYELEPLDDEEAYMEVYKLYTAELEKHDEEIEKASLGLAGMVRMGAAWESPDIFFALATTLEHARLAPLSHLAVQRVRELGHAGRPALRGLDPQNPKVHLMLKEPRIEALDEYWRAARDEADSWHAERTAFMNGRLSVGLHPDTDKDFWQGYRSSTSPPALEDDKGAVERSIRWDVFKVILLVAGPMLLLIFVRDLLRFMVRRSERRQRSLNFEA